MTSKNTTAKKKRTRQRSSPASPQGSSQDEQTGDMVTRRQEKIDDYREEALKNPDPLRANLGVVVSDLLELEYRYKQAMDAAFAAGNNPLETFQNLGAAMDGYHRTVRQIDRFARLDTQHSSRRKPSSRKPR